MVQIQQEQPFTANKEKFTMTLDEVPIGRKVKVLEVKCQHELKRRLGSMGLFEGVIVKPVQKSFGIAAVEVLCSTRIGIDEDVMKGVYV